MAEDKKNKDKMAKEPIVKYNAIHFSSVEDQEQSNYRFWNSLTPEQRLHHVVDLIKRLFSGQLTNAKKYSRIHFDKP